MSDIAENIVREISWNHSAFQDEWVRMIRTEERKQRRALNRFHRWRANIMDKGEASDYTQAVEECIRRISQGI